MSLSQDLRSGQLRIHMRFLIGPKRSPVWRRAMDVPTITVFGPCHPQSRPGRKASDHGPGNARADRWFPSHRNIFTAGLRPGLQRAERACETAASPLASAPLLGPRKTERWLSGRKHRTRNAAYLYGYRGFESHPLRHFGTKLGTPPAADSVIDGHCSSPAIAMGSIGSTSGSSKATRSCTTFGASLRPWPRSIRTRP